MSSAPCRLWLCDSDFIPLRQPCVGAMPIRPAGYFQKITFGEREKKSLFYNIAQVLRNIDMVVWVPPLHQLLLVPSKVYVKTATLSKENIDDQRKRKDKLKQSNNQCVGEEKKTYRSVEWKPAETQRQDFSLRGKQCKQMTEKGMLPNLLAADVACWTELSFSGILGRSGTVDLQQAERCGREDWQETERRDLFREPLCVVTEWQDGEVCEMAAYSSALEGR